MKILRSTFKVLTLCGCWRPPSWSPWKRQIYDIYTVFVFLVLHAFSLSQLMDIILIVDNSDKFTDTFYVLLSVITSCCKICNLLTNRNSIYVLCNVLVKEPCKPIDVEELKIQAKFEGVTKSNLIYYTLLVESAVICFISTSLFTGFSKKELIFRGWIPYKYSSGDLFYPTYIHQAIGIMASALINVAGDALICGLLVHICSQMEILKYRLNKVTNDKGNGLRNCVYHHNRIYRFAYKINKQFRLTLSVQFFSSMLVVCFNLYQLTKTKSINAESAQFGLYMACTLLEIFFYCWYGNEVKIKSQQIAEQIFKTDWTSLNNANKRILLVIMRRAMVPIEFTSAYVVTINLGSFVGLLKTSYSAYNLLQQISK